MVYVTLLDQFHPGIYSSQVIDVCNHISKKTHERVRLLAFLSIREIQYAKPKIKSLYPDSIVLPAAPGLANFKLTALLLAVFCLLTGERTAICRNVFATTIGLKVKSWRLLKKVIYDGRSSINAEIKEYDVFPVPYLRKNIFQLEKKAILNADYRMAVSNKLLEYWKINYKYNGNKHAIINCTLDSKYFNEQMQFHETVINERRQVLGFKQDDVILIYSGSTAPWQSFDLMYNTFKSYLKNQPDLKFIFLSGRTREIEFFEKKFPNQVFNFYVSQSEILNYLLIGDYGVLLREQSQTNRVAAPVKFAEYLYAGLKIIISDNLGDYSEMVHQDHLGYLLKGELNQIQKVGMEDKVRVSNYAFEKFSKNAFYDKQLDFIIEQSVI